MARNRMIKPSFWTDAKMCRLRRDIRLLYIGLWNFVDDLGVITANPEQIKNMIFPFDGVRIDVIDKWLDELVSIGVMERLDHNGFKYFRLLNFLKHQSICRPNIKDVNIPQNELLKMKGVEANEEPTPPQEVKKKKSKKQKKRIEEHSAVIPVEPVHTEEPKTQEDIDFESFEKWLKDHAPNILKMSKPFTKKQFLEIRSEYDPKYVADLLQKMHNWKPLASKNVSAYLTFKNWARRDDDQSSKARTTQTNGVQQRDTGVGADYAASIYQRLGCGAGSESFSDI